MKKNINSGFNKSTIFMALLIGLSLLGVGCGPESQLNRARKAENAGKHLKAWERYQKFAAQYPESPFAAEAIFRAGWVAQSQFNDCYMASTFYDQVINNYPEVEPWSGRALFQKNNCPDYFPLFPGNKWEEVDSDTKGKNARIDIASSDGPKGKNVLQSAWLMRKFFAGEKQFQTTQTLYTKNQNGLWERETENDPAPIKILEWPLDKGASWSNVESGKRVYYEIISLAEDVSVAAGKFSDCLVVRSNMAGSKTYKLDYYAPNVGRILTSQKTGGEEKRIKELMSFSISATEEKNNEPKENKEESKS